MKKILLCLSILFCISAASQSLDSLDAKKGYKDISLGISLDSLKNITKVKTGIMKWEVDDKLYYWITDTKYRSFADS